MSRAAWSQHGQGGTAVVLLHGIGGGAAIWGDAGSGTVQALVQAGYRAVPVDLPGYGQAADAPAPDLAALVQAVQGVLTALRAQPQPPAQVVLLGHSMGGMVAQALVAQAQAQAQAHGQGQGQGPVPVPGQIAPSGSSAPATAPGRALQASPYCLRVEGPVSGPFSDPLKRPAEADAAGPAYDPSQGPVQGLVLACTSAAFGKPDGDWQARFVAERLAPLDAGLGMPGLADQLVPGLLAPNAAPTARQLACRVMAAVPEATYRAVLRAIAGFDGRAALPRLQLPTLLLAAEHDRTAPPDVMQRMAARLPQADYQCLAGAGHIANVEAPQAFNAAVLAFLARHFPAARPAA